MNAYSKITMGNSGLQVPDYPIIPYIEGDGIGSDTWSAAVHVFENAVEKSLSSVSAKSLVDANDVESSDYLHAYSIDKRRIMA